jgi:hypothetical protein
MWKPGQLVTINRRTYRIVKSCRYTCILCAFDHAEANEYPCKQCSQNILMPDGCYLKRVYKASDIKHD